MKRAVLFFTLAILSFSLFAQSWVRVNNLGYLPTDIKVAVMLSKDLSDGSFEIFDSNTDSLIFRGKGKSMNGNRWGMKSAYRLDFSSLSKNGGYYIVSNGAKSPSFRISPDVYDGLADYLLVYMRQQRCGDNPFTGEMCHIHDGYIVDHPTRSGEKIDVTGGWHDATDYLQYLTTSSTATYHLLFAYHQQKDKSIFKDNYDAKGRVGHNGIPDILDEAKWGLDWVNKMNPERRVMFNQIADDRDHAGFREPQNDKVDYGWGAGNGRPVYFVTGAPQGLGKWINRTTGVSSTAGKFASTFALGAALMKNYYPEFAQQIQDKAQFAYEFGVEKLGNTQTACLLSPYFYEEDSYVDDLELAAATLFQTTNDPKWKIDANYWGELEPVTPWMELGRGRHYQYYPFINLGHYLLASSGDSKLKMKYAEFMRQGLQSLKDRAADDPFINGIPFIWCSNNLTSAAITQARLYNEVSGDNSFLEMEASLRDWLLGCNPWGTSMIVGLPTGYDYPDSPHSSYTVLNGDLTYGGLVDGPVYKTVFDERAGKSLRNPDKYYQFNNGIAVYHDDIGDYASNEPTMDGTAGLTYYFAKQESVGKELKKSNLEKDKYGAIVRVNPEEKKIYLVFSADSLFNGGNIILKTLKREGIKGSFFLTGNCLRMKEHKELIENIISEGHYVGGHSDKHLLYAPWGNRDSSLVTKEEIVSDMRNNIAELEKFGIKVDQSRWFLPPYEYYNAESVAALRSIGLNVINLTPGSVTAADYTYPGMSNYKPTQLLINSLYRFEEMGAIDGAILLIHPGVVKERPDPLYLRLREIIKTLKRKGYKFDSFTNVTI